MNHNTPLNIGHMLFILTEIQIYLIIVSLVLSLFFIFMITLISNLVKKP
jgi:hypothetical protein